MAELLFEKGRAGARAAVLPKNEYGDYALCGCMKREKLELPELSEVEVVRHYMELSRRAHGVDNGFYPLGSCTMKYNMKSAEKAAALPGFAGIHPLQSEKSVQGALEMMYDMQQCLNEIAGMDETTLQPAAGAHGEWTGLLLIRAYHASRGDAARTKILVPDAAHGTNPASAAMCGYDVVAIPSRADGMVDLDALEAALDENVAALMLTNPSTLGMFEVNIDKIAEMVHNAGGLLYYDGANMNAIMGITRPGDMGFDVVHWNVHKTLGTPHGGGGPGSGPVGCKEFLAKFLPRPMVIKKDDGSFGFDCNMPDSIGAVKAFYGNFLVALKGYCYVKALGGKGLRRASENAVLNANYMLQALEKYSTFKYEYPCMHEFVLSLEGLHDKTGVSALDVAKSMIDYGIHPPTMYFPLIVHECLMFEPTETESREQLDRAIEIFDEIIATAELEPDILHEAPVSMPIGRPDEVTAARKPIVVYTEE